MKLVLFDIDGTLVYHIDQNAQAGFPRFVYAIKKAYGIDADFSRSYSGHVDKEITRSVVPRTLFPQEKFDARWETAKQALLEYSETLQSGYRKYYGPIPDAVRLAEALHADERYMVGILTGNIERMARWKLHHAGVDPHLFSFGLYGDDAENRIELAQTVFQKFENQFHRTIQGDDITVIGDSVHDVRCGKAIGAKTIAVATGNLTGPGGIHGGVSHYANELEQEHPDLFVRSLLAPKVLRFFGLSHLRRDQKKTTMNV